MANGDGAMCGRHDEAIEELRRRMTALESITERTAEGVQELRTNDRLRTARLDRSTKIWLSTLALLGPVLTAVVAHYLQ